MIVYIVLNNVWIWAKQGDLSVAENLSLNSYCTCTNDYCLHTPTKPAIAHIKITEMLSIFCNYQISARHGEQPATISWTIKKKWSPYIEHCIGKSVFNKLNRSLAISHCYVVAK